ncbi:MAG TPA: protein kinase [Planctomycetota bacterium]|nr:protein kinase [Planctomycetota bacterium]
MAGTPGATASCARSSTRPPGGGAPTGTRTWTRRAAPTARSGATSSACSRPRASPRTSWSRPRPPHPPPVLGPFRLEREIGRGGMGTVYEAIDTRSSARVALKALHPYLLGSPTLRDRFTREARLGKQVSHRNVVRTLGYERVEGYDLLVMEYVEGRTLRGLVEAWGTVPEAFLREIARQAASGLAAIHDAGIVHRDLKPENILVADDRRVRIMDLGVAKIRDASVALTTEGQFLGSLPYAAPEQCEGGEVGPAADLYSLGVVLYELATGENPFRSETPGASVRAHLDVVPPHATERNGEVSSFLGELLATLLAKRPERRFASARALAAALEAGERGDWWRVREQEIRARRLPRVLVSRDTSFVGRGAELDRMRAAWRSACAGEGQAVVLEGEPGIGKSRIIDAFLRELDPDRSHVLYGSFPPGGELRGLVDAVVNLFGRGRIDRELGTRLGELAAIAPAVADLMRDGVGPREPETLAAAFRELLLGLSRERPVVWAVDDLHFAPARARAVAYAMARAASEGRVLLLLSARSLPAEEIASLERLPHVRRIPVPRLADADAAALAREALGREQGAIEIARRSDGVPFFACELARAADKGPAPELPSAVRGFLSVRVAALGSEDRALLDVGAVQGFEFDGDLLAAALGLPIVTALQRLADIERATGLVRADGRRYRFDHHLVQEILYEELPPRLREEYHTRIADAFTDREGPVAARFLAAHHLRGIRPEAALPFLPAALDHLARRFQSEEALGLLDRALRLPLPEAGRVDLLVEQAARFEMLGRRAPQRQAADEAIELARSLGDPRRECLAQLARGTLSLGVSRDDEAVTHFERAVALAREVGDEALVMHATARLGTVLGRMRRDGEAMNLLAGVRDWARRTGNVVEEIRALTGLGTCLRHLVRQAEAHNAFAAALFLCEQAGLRRERSYVEGNLGTSLWLLGRFEEAGIHLERNVALAAEIGDRRGECAARGNLGLVLRDLGHLGDAVACFRTHLALAEEIDSRRAQAIARMNLGEMLGTLGDVEGEARELGLAQALADEIGQDYLRGRTLYARARRAEADGDAPLARRLREQALACARAAGDGVGEAWILLALGGDDPAPLRDADERARALAQPALEILAAARRGDFARAEAVLDREGARLGMPARIEGHYRIWKGAGVARHLEEAARLLAAVRDRVPPEAREAMVERVASFREIHNAAGERRISPPGSPGAGAGPPRDPAAAAP